MGDLAVLIFQGDALAYGVALLAGILSFFSPCVLPLVPGYLGYLGSLQGTGTDTKTGMARARLVVSAVFFTLGFIAIFIALGLGGNLIHELNFVNQNKVLFQRIGGGLILLLGVHFLGLLRIGILDREVRYIPNFRKGGMLASFIVGLAFGFGWTACVGPVLASIFIMVSSGGVRPAFLLVYGIGIGLPFVVVALFMDVFIRRFTSMRSAMPVAKITLGLLMVLTGGLMITGHFGEIGFWMLENIGIFRGGLG